MKKLLVFVGFLTCLFLLLSFPAFADEPEVTGFPYAGSSETLPEENPAPEKFQSSYLSSDPDNPYLYSSRVYLVRNKETGYAIRYSYPSSLYQDQINNSTCDPDSVDFFRSGMLVHIIYSGSDSNYYLKVGGKYISTSGTTLTISTSSFTWHIVEDATGYFRISPSDNSSYSLGVTSYSSGASIVLNTGTGNLNRWDLLMTLDVPTVTQSTDYYCGPASVLQINQCSESDSIIVPGSTPSQQQDYLANQAGTTPTDGTTVGGVLSILNSWNSVGYYGYKAGGDEYSTGWTIDLFKNIVSSNISWGIPNILKGPTTYLAYYNGATYYHYICIIGISANSGRSRMVLNDCINNASYNGVHIENTANVYSVLVLGAGGLIHCSSNYWDSF
ncbi:MAG: C39 family peptidase [Clostridia bacterium]|nr:C39 family peptidase [Clostridia bacterium]